jgi:hypothetical protein
MRNDVDTKLLAKFEQTKVDHISDHIQEWKCHKSLIKVSVPPALLLEWFLNSLVPQLSKDVATLGVFSDKETIMRGQQLELIYSRFGLLYGVFPYVPWIILNKTRHKSRPNVDGIVGSIQENPTDQLSNQLQQSSI